MLVVPASQTRQLRRQQAMLERHWQDVTQTFVEFPRQALERSIPERFEQIVGLHADRVAVKTKDTVLTFAVLNRQANRLARAVIARLGKENEPVALLFERGAAAIAAMFGMLKANKIYVALDPSYPLERLQSFLTDSQSRLILTNSRNLRLAKELARQAAPHDQPEILVFEEIDSNNSDDDLNLAISSDAYGSIVYTSGSTGQPKGTIQSHRHILHHVMLVTNLYRICPIDRQPQFFSYSYSAILSSVYPMLLSGAMLVPAELEVVGIGNLADWLVENKITILHLLPQFYRQFFASLPSPDSMRFPQLRVLAVGGATITSQDIAAWLAHLPLDCIVGHSLASAEALGTARFLIDRETPLPYDTIPVGYPEPDKEILLVDERGLPVAPGMAGEIVVKSRYLVPGYWKKPELTEELFRPDPDGSDKRLFFSGDLARWRPDGTLELLGRKDFQVKIRGYTVQLGEVEMALYSLGSIKEAVVIAAPDGKENQRLVAYIVPKSKPGPAVSELRAKLNDKLPVFAVPSLFVYLDALPRTPNGKIDRMALPQPTSLRPNLAQPYVQAKDDLQAKLVQIWEDVLGVHAIGVQDNFFDLGGDSLKAEMLSLEIKARLGKDYPASSLLEAPTIEKIAAVIAKPSQAARYSVIVAIQSEGSKPPLFLAHGLGGGLFQYATLARLLGPDQPVYGIEAASVDEFGSESFEDIIAHYVDEFLDLHPSGPYLLGGYSYGAAVAYEMARQMEQRGHPVALLAIFDYTLVAEYRQIRLSPKLVSGFFKNLPNWLIGFSGLDSRLKWVTIKRWTRRLKKVLHNRQNALKVLTTIEFEDHAQVLGSISQDRLEQIEREWVRVRRHTFQPYSGRLTLFRAQAQPILCSFDPEMNWRKLARGELSVEIVPGLHYELMNDRNIRVLACKLKRCLDQLQTE